MSNKKQAWANAHSQLWTSLVPRSSGSRTQSEISSIATPDRDRSLLDDVGNYERTNDVSVLSRSQINSSRPKEKILVQVSDILESYGAISKESDIPAVLLSVVKELEEAKRVNSFNSMVLREYSETVRRRFCLYGEEAPPSVAELSERLRDGSTAKPVAGPSPVWLEEQLGDLRRLIEDEFQLCYGENANFSLPTLLPDAAHTKLNISQILQKSRDLLSRLSNEHRDVKKIIFEKLGDAPALTDRRRTLTLAEALTEIESRQVLENTDAVSSSALENEKGQTFKAALQSIIDTVPASLQIHFELQGHDTPVLTQCDNLKHLLQFLLSEYLSMERYIEKVEMQRQKLVQTFRLPSIELDDKVGDDNMQIDDALERSLDALKKTVTAVVTFPHQISEEEIALRRDSAEAVDKLAQLLVESRRTGSSSGTPGYPNGICSTPTTRIEPPTCNLLEMVEMVKSRFATLLSQQQRKELAGAQSRVGFAHMEEAMKSHGKQVLQQLREMCSMQDDGSGAEQAETLSELMGGLDTERNLTPAKLDFFLSDVGERLRMVKTKFHRALNAAASNKTRADTAMQKCAAAQKRLHKVAICAERLGTEGLGLTFPSKFSGCGGDTDDAVGRGSVAPMESESGRGDGVSALRRLNLRPASDASPHKAATTTTTCATAATAGMVTEGNVLEALEFIASRVCADDALRDQLKLREEIVQLRKSEVRWKADTSAFHEAMTMLMQRLASNGRLVKQSLFMMGTDESAKDDLVEEVLQHGEKKAVIAEEDAEAEVEYVERSLAELLQKYTRWAQRLQQTTEDHLYTQRKIVKYFAAVRRFFTSQGNKDAMPPEDIPDDNLYDIDSCLMRAADIILPALDAAIQGVEGRPRAQASGAAAGVSSPPPSVPLPLSPVIEGQAAQRQDVIMQLVKDSAAAAAGGVLPYDHRIARLYETVARLYTAVTSLMQVHYLCIPSGVKRRSTGDVELLFDGDASEDGFVDIDLDRLIRVSQHRSGGQDVETGSGESGRFAREGASEASRGVNSPPLSTVAANNDVILRVTYQNMEVLQDTLKRFSATHKMAAIVLQKDMDAMQQQLASMLEKYSEVDIETAFHQSREELRGLYVTLRDRAEVQKGCYFFNRIGGEGSCTWVTALEKLSEGFCGVVDRLVQRTAQVAEYRELRDEVVDMCAMYVNWAEHHSLPPSYALSPELLAMCLRDGKTAGAAGHGSGAGDSGVARNPLSSPTSLSLTGAAAAASTAKVTQLPPKPSGTPPLTPRDTIKQQQQESQTAQGVDSNNNDAAAEAKVMCFTEDRAVLKVIQHMFQVVQHAAESAEAPVPFTTTNATAIQEAEARTHQLNEEMSLLREAVAVAERHVDELTEAKQTLERQRDQAQSEAAVARAELRRWKRQQQQEKQQRVEVNPTPPQSLRDIGEGRAASGSSPSHTPQPSSASDADAMAMDETTVREVMAYMKLLSEELQTAKQRAGAGLPSDQKPQPQPQQHHHWRRRLQEHDGGDIDVEERRDSELVHSPCPVELGGTGGESTLTPPPPPPATTFSQPFPNRYAALAEEVRHRYGGASLAPLVVVDPQPHYSAVRGSATGQRRYSPVKFRGPAYDACDRYYTRELAEGEGERRAEQVQRRCGGTLNTITSAGDHTHIHDDIYSVKPPSMSHLMQPRTPQRQAPRGHSSNQQEAGRVHYDTYFGGSGNVARRSAGRPHATVTTPHRYPRSLTRNEPLRMPASAVDAPSSRVYQAPQRATPVVSPSVSNRARPHPAAVLVQDDGSFPGRYPMDEDEGEDVFYDEAALHQLDGGWRVPSQLQRRPSAARRPTLSTHVPPTSRTTSPGASTASLSHSGQPDQSANNFSTNLAAAVQKIEAVTRRSQSGGYSKPTPTRRSANSRHALDTPAAFVPIPEATPERAINQNVNLRSAALRRLAEVVSRTKVTPLRGARF